MSGFTDFITSGPRAFPTVSEQLSNFTCCGTPSTLCAKHRSARGQDEQQLSGLLPQPPQNLTQKVTLYLGQKGRCWQARFFWSPAEAC